MHIFTYGTSAAVPLPRHPVCKWWCYFLLLIVPATACRDRTPPQSNGNPPPNVISAFQSKFPHASELQWDTYEGHYSANFSNNDYRVEASFNPDGSLIDCTTYISLEELPDTIINFIDAHYPDNGVSVISKYEKNGQTSFQLELETALEYLKLSFDPNGTLMKESKEPLSKEEMEEVIEDKDT